MQCCHLTVIWFNTVNSTQFLLKIKTWAQQSWCIANKSVLVEYEYVLVDRWYFAAISDSLNEFLITAQFYFRNATCLEGKWMCIIEGYWYNPCLSISLYNKYTITIQEHNIFKISWWLLLPLTWVCRLHLFKS